MRVAVLGVGLIGGSIGLAARQRDLAEVTGYVRRPEKAAECLDRGAVDRMADTIPAAVEGADVVFCCAAVGALPEMARAALDAAGPDCVVTDVGSTKRELVAGLDGDSRFVGGHPLAGAETAGVANARADLYEGARWFLTPGESSSGVLIDRLQRLIRGLGARPVAIDPAEHDEAMAVVSHLPHVLANQLAVQGRAGTERLSALAPSLRDGIRVAGANPGVWAQIYRSNRVALAAAVRESAAGLERAADLIESADETELAAWQAAAAAERERISAVEEGARPTYLLRVAVPNRPGVLAELTLQLSREGVNIADMSLDPAADMSSGAISLWIAGADEAKQAEGLIRDLGHPVTRQRGEL